MFVAVSAVLELGETVPVSVVEWDPRDTEEVLDKSKEVVESIGDRVLRPV